MRTVTAAVIGLVVLLGLVSATRGTEPQAIVARVNGAPVTRVDIGIEMERILPTASYHGSLDREAWQRVVDRAIEAATDRELICQAALKKGLDVPDKRLKEMEAEVITQAGSKKAFEDWLRARGLTREEFRETQRKYELAATLEGQVVKEIEGRAPPSDVDLKRYYDANRSKFVIPPSVDVQHLLVRVQPWANNEEWKKRELRAGWIAKRARSGEDFGRLVNNYSDDQDSKGSGGRLNSVHEGRFAEPIEKVVEGIKPGQIGGPVRSLYGYHVVKLLARHPPSQLEFAQVDREQLRTDLRRKAIRDAVEDWHRGLRKGPRVVVDQAQVDMLRSQPGSATRGSTTPPRGTE